MATDQKIFLKYRRFIDSLAMWAPAGKLAINA
jgi:hypothetical protein